MSEARNPLLDLLDPKFPLVYEKILPSEKHFQMTRSKLSKECAVCERPFTVFFWRVNGIPFKTVICQICAKSANVCQVSLLDLDLGIPVIVRNKIMQTQTEDFKSSVRRWYNNRLVDKKITEDDEWMDKSFREKVLSLDPVTVTRVQQLVDADPYLSFRKAPVCPEWLSNECKHGSTCYYAHKLPGPGEHSPDYTKFGVRCRYLGTVDPNGKAIIEKLLLIDQTIFEAREDPTPIKEPEPEPQPRSEGSVMTPPAVPEIPETDAPLPYECLAGFDFSKLPKYENGVLKR